MNNPRVNVYVHFRFRTRDIVKVTAVATLTYALTATAIKAAAKAGTIQLTRLNEKLADEYEKETS